MNENSPQPAAAFSPYTAIGEPLMEQNLNERYYGQELSRTWKADLGDRPDTAHAVSFLCGLANGSPVLEFGIGTGRIALGLVEQGIEVAGIENSPWMLNELKKAGGTSVDVRQGDFCHLDINRRFGTVLLASFTLFAVLSQEAQVNCFRNAFRHLHPGGLFVIELPSLFSGIFENGRAPISISSGWYEHSGEGNEVWILLRSVNKAMQEAEMCYVNLRSGELPRLRPSASRYAGPAEVDLMAKTVGFSSINRWSSWRKKPYTPDSLSYIAVYQRPEADTS